MFLLYVGNKYELLLSHLNCTNILEVKKMFFFSEIKKKYLSMSYLNEELEQRLKFLLNSWI